MFYVENHTIYEKFFPFCALGKFHVIVKQQRKETESWKFFLLDYWNAKS